MVRLNRDELSRIERGETTQIRFETLAKLLAGYRCGLSICSTWNPLRQTLRNPSTRGHWRRFGPA